MVPGQRRNFLARLCLSCSLPNEQTAPEQRKPLPRRLGEGLGTTRVRLKAEAETRPGWHARVKGALPATLRFGSPSPQAGCRPPSAHANVGPLGIAPGVDHLLLTQARVTA